MFLEETATIKVKDIDMRNYAKFIKKDGGVLKRGKLYQAVLENKVMRL